MAKIRSHSFVVRIGLSANRFDAFEVTSTVPGPNDKERDREVSEAIAKWGKVTQLRQKHNVKKLAA